MFRYSEKLSKRNQATAISRNPKTGNGRPAGSDAALQVNRPSVCAAATVGRASRITASRTTPLFRCDFRDDWGIMRGSFRKLDFFQPIPGVPVRSARLVSFALLSAGGLWLGLANMFALSSAV